MNASERIGSVLDRYRIEKELGRGGFGAVYLARHVLMDRLVALKVLHPEGARDAGMRERFLREAQAAAAVGHDAIVQVFDSGMTPEGEPFIVMEFLEGEDLEVYLQRSGALSWGDAVCIMVDVLDGLTAAHAAGIVHRDLKPANIFLKHGATHSVKLLDFGISKMAGDGVRKLTRTGMVMGTPHYMAPETFLGSSQVDARADLYAVAAILHELISGKPPHDAETYEELIVKVATMPAPSLRNTIPGLPLGLAVALDQGLTSDPNQRWQSAAEFRSALLPFAAPKLAHGLATAPMAATAPKTDINPMAPTGMAATGMAMTPPGHAIGAQSGSGASPSHHLAGAPSTSVPQTGPMQGSPPTPGVTPISAQSPLPAFSNPQLPVPLASRNPHSPAPLASHTPSHVSAAALPSHAPPGASRRSHSTGWLLGAMAALAVISVGGVVAYQSASNSPDTEHESSSSTTTPTVPVAPVSPVAPVAQANQPANQPANTLPDKPEDAPGARGTPSPEPIPQPIPNADLQPVLNVARVAIDWNGGAMPEAAERLANRTQPLLMECAASQPTRVKIQVMLSSGNIFVARPDPRGDSGPDAIARCVAGIFSRGGSVGVDSGGILVFAIDLPAR